MSRTQSILVVEDETDLSQLIADYLESDGLAAAQAHSGAEALERLQGFAYDGLVVDLRLPDADGMDILEKALARFPGHPRGGDHRLRRRRGRGDRDQAQGAVDFLIKPFQLASSPRCCTRRSSKSPAPERGAGGAARRRSSFDEIIGQSESLQKRLLDPAAGVADGQHRADSGRDRHRQGTDRADHSREQPAARSAVSSPSTPRPFQRRWPKPSCSATSKARSPARSRAGSAGSSSRTAARCSSTKWRRCACRCRPSCCARSRSARSSASATRVR